MVKVRCVSVPSLSRLSSVPVPYFVPVSRLCPICVPWDMTGTMVVVVLDCPELWRCVPVKKAVVLMLSLLLCLPFFASAEEYPSGWYSLSDGNDVVASMLYLPEDCSVSLPDSMSLSPLEAVKPFTAAPGQYVAGVDFPSGEYSVRCAEGESLFNIRVKDEEGFSVFSDGFWADKDEYLGKIKLLDGYSVSIDQGKAYFSAPSGIVFD